MQPQIAFYKHPDEWTAEPPHRQAPVPQFRPLTNVSFKEKLQQELTSRQKRSIGMGILWLPLNSIVASFASGKGTLPPAEDLVPYVRVSKNWHWGPNQHCSLELGWKDEQGWNTLFAKAHVHRNGLEMLFLCYSGVTLVRAYEWENYEWHPPPARRKPIKLTAAEEAVFEKYGLDKNEKKPAA